MKHKSYIEELEPSDCFTYRDSIFLLTKDYRKDMSRMSISLLDGSVRWFKSSDVVEKVDIYVTNNDGHLIDIKNYHVSDKQN